MSEKVKKPVIFVFSTAYLPFIGGAEVAIEQVAKRLGDKYDFFIFTSRMRRDLPKREVRSEGGVVRVGLGTRFENFLPKNSFNFYHTIWLRRRKSRERKAWSDEFGVSFDSFAV